jgi:hypothetical protein
LRAISIKVAVKSLLYNFVGDGGGLNPPSNGHYLPALLGLLLDQLAILGKTAELMIRTLKKEDLENV